MGALKMEAVIDSDEVSVVIASTAQSYADRLNECQSEIAGTIIYMGELLIEAKAQLKGKKGEWERMFSDQENPVKRPCRFGIRTAQMLMKVARHPALSKTKHVSLLPPHWGTLYEISKLKPEQVEEAIEKGKIHPGLEREDATALRKEFSSPEQKPEKPWDHCKAMDRTEKILEKLWKEWPKKDLPTLMLTLRMYARYIEDELDERTKEFEAATELAAARSDEQINDDDLEVVQ